MKDGELMVEKMNRGMTWLDTGTLDSLHEASSYIRSLEEKTRIKDRVSRGNCLENGIYR